MPVTNVNINKYYFEKPKSYLKLYLHILFSLICFRLLGAAQIKAPDSLSRPEKKRVLESKCQVKLGVGCSYGQAVVRTTTS